MITHDWDDGDDIDLDDLPDDTPPWRAFLVCCVLVACGWTLYACGWPLLGNVAIVIAAVRGVWLMLVG
jgi:hypothetical protein